MLPPPPGGGGGAPPAPLPQPASASEPLALPEDETPSALPAARTLAEPAPAAPPEPPPAPPSSSPPHPSGLHQRPAGPAAACLCMVPWAASRGVGVAQGGCRLRAPPPSRRCLPAQRREACWWERGARGSRQAQAACRLAYQRGGASRLACQLARARPGASVAARPGVQPRLAVALLRCHRSERTAAGGVRSRCRRVLRLQVGRMDRWSRIGSATSPCGCHGRSAETFRPSRARSLSRAVALWLGAAHH